MSVTTRHGRLGPQNAYARWTEACAAAGWHGSPVPEEVYVADGRDRVLAEPVHARWPSPRCDCGDGRHSDRRPGRGVMAEIDALGLDLLKVRQLTPCRESPEPDDARSP
jgi:hypothetical protein